MAPIRSLAKQLLRYATRVLHPVRRAWARRHVSRLDALESVLFICLGNVCRSPYAEYSFRRMASTPRATSAGFIGPGRSSPESAQAVARECGVDLSSHVSQVVTADLVRGFDLVVVMEPGQCRRIRSLVGGTVPVIVLGDLDPQAPDRRTIPDPWGKDVEAFRSSFERIDRCLHELRVAADPLFRPSQPAERSIR